MGFQASLTLEGLILVWTYAIFHVNTNLTITPIALNDWIRAHQWSGICGSGNLQVVTLPMLINTDTDWDVDSNSGSDVNDSISSSSSQAVSPIKGDKVHVHCAFGYFEVQWLTFLMTAWVV
jgi:hypothetical protein